MSCRQNKHLFLLCCFLLFFVALSPVFALEVRYPVLSTGSQITPSSSLEQYLRYVFDIGMFIGFFAVIFSLAWAGVLYFLSPAMPSALANAKDRVSGSVSGLIILLTFYLIITTINPSLSIFNVKKLEPAPPPPEKKEQPGAYFYGDQSCAEDKLLQQTVSSIPDFGDKKNKIKGAISYSDPADYFGFYISILYEANDYWGRCQYLDPFGQCKKVLITPNSASVHEYSFFPEGDGVYFYRKPFFDQKGGWLRISNSEITQKFFEHELKYLSFTGMNRFGSCTVPVNEQDCVKWDAVGNCSQRQCPNLSKENIGSIKIEGDFMVMLVYWNERTDTNSLWSFCQEYPMKGDANREGPRQIKWDAIRKTGNLPNWVIIIPVAQK